VSIAFSILFALADIGFFVGLLIWINRLPNNRDANKAPEEIHFSATESLKALGILNNEGPKTPEQLAERMGISVQKAEAMLGHLGKSDFVRLDIEPDIVPPVFRITPDGQTASQQH